MPRPEWTEHFGVVTVEAMAEALRARMAEAAQARARRFSRAACVDAMLALLLGPLLA